MFCLKCKKCTFCNFYRKKSGEEHIIDIFYNLNCFLLVSILVKYFFLNQADFYLQSIIPSEGKSDEFSINKVIK